MSLSPIDKNKMRNYDSTFELNSLKKLIFFLSSKERRSALMLLIFSLLTALIDTLGIASIMPFIAILTNLSLIETNSILNQVYLFANKYGVENKNEFIFFLGIFVFLFLVFSISLNAYTKYIQLKFIENRHHSISTLLIERYLNQPYSWFLNRNSAVLGSTVLSEASQVVALGMKPLIEIISSFFVISFIFILMLYVDYKLAISVIVILGGAYLIIYLLTDRLGKKIGKERFVANQKRFTIVNEAFGASKEIKVAGLEEVYLNQFIGPSIVHANRSATAGFLAGMPRFALEAIAFGGMMLVLLYLVGQKGNFSNAIPIISLYAFAGYRMLPSLQKAYHASTMLRFCSPAIESLYDIIKNLNPNNIIKSKETIDFKKSIVLKNLNFKYPNSSNLTLKNINIEIQHKKIIGLVGPTGSGKTTLVDVILGILTPQDGTLLVDGKIINNNNLRTWQNNIGYLPQIIYLSDDTIAKNIAFGVNSEEINQEALERAAKIANLHNFITTELPEKYNTTVGERGIRLSGGQRQRIGIARALYHNPKILILDEATSALDNDTEKAVMDAINNLGNDITIILIAHRLTTIKKCDEIIKIENGSIVAKGKFEELINDYQN